MKHCAMVMAVTLAGCLTGCQSAGARPCEARRLEGPARRSTTARVIAVQPLLLGHTYRTDKVLRLADVAGPQRTWQILVGPNLSGGTATICYTNTEPDIFVENGWAYVVVASTGPPPTTGSDWGQARTKRVSGTAAGTRFIVQEQNGVHRVILLSGPPDTVRVILDGDRKTGSDLKAPQTFFEVGPQDKTLPPPQTIDDHKTPAVSELVQHVETVAALAGVK